MLSSLELLKLFILGPGYIKYGFPLCFSMTMLSWSLIEYRDAYLAAGEYRNAISALKWGMDYILKTHIHERFVLYNSLNFASYFYTTDSLNFVSYTTDAQKWKLVCLHCFTCLFQ